jgi:uncharacterized membrane protein
MKVEISKIFIPIIKEFCVYTLLLLGTFILAKTIVQYTSLETTIGFLASKQLYIHNSIWRIAFYTHVFTSLFILLAGFTQFNLSLRLRYPFIHKLIGKLYISLILFVNFPAGFIMAIYANGFLPSKISFIILDVLWFAFTLQSFLAIRKMDIESHKNNMIRSYALTCSAITLRSWKLIINSIMVIDPNTLYMIDAWLGWVPNLLFAEYVIRRK